jgi:uncharacterized protein
MAMFSAREKKDLKQLIASVVNPEEFLSLEGLHGFLFGLVIIPEPIMPSEWLPCILGEGMLDVQGKDDADLLMGSLFGVYNRMTQQNRDGDLLFPFDYETMKQKDIQRMRDWAKGFFFATNLRPEVWGMEGDEEYDDLEPDIAEPDELDDDNDEDFDDIFDEDAEIAGSFAVIMGVAFPERIPEIFSNPEGNPDALDFEDPELEAKLFAMLDDAVETLRVYAEPFGDDLEEECADNYHVPQMPIHVEKVGRNEPCPCGSGAKYKKCCGK